MRAAERESDAAAKAHAARRGTALSAAFPDQSPMTPVVASESTTFSVLVLAGSSTAAC